MVKMDFSIPEELSVFGVTSDDFAEKKGDLSKSINEEISENDIIWELYKDLIKKNHNFEILQLIYWNMAIFKDKLGLDSFEYQQKSHKSRLLNLKQQGKNKVKINSIGCSASCRKIHNLVLPLSMAIQNLPIPNPKCEATLNSSYTWCNSIYLLAKEKEPESKKLPPATLDIPDLPEVVENLEKFGKVSLLNSEKRFLNNTESNLMGWILSSLTFFFWHWHVILFSNSRCNSCFMEYIFFSAVKSFFK